MYMIFWTKLGPNSNFFLESQTNFPLVFFVFLYRVLSFRYGWGQGRIDDQYVYVYVRIAMSQNCQ